MLNTNSRLGAITIWAAIAALVAHAIWTFLGWPHVADATRLVLASESAAFAARNQVMIAGLAGFGAVALALLCNGWRNRSEARHAIERRERRLGHVLASEAEDLAGTCEVAARALVGTPSSAGAVLSDLARTIDGSEHALLSMPSAELAMLGPGAAAAARNVRTAMRGLGHAVASSKADSAGYREIAQRAMETAFVARASATVLAALARRGVGAADKLRTMPLPDAAEIASLIGSAGSDSGVKPSRLQTVV